MTDSVATPGKVRVVSIGADQISFPFDGKPSVYLKALHSYGRSLEVDPFPAYAHDAGQVEMLAAEVCACFPIRFDTTFYVLPCELPSRTNAHATRDFIYDCKCEDCKALAPSRDQERRWEPHVVLQAKRIPPHPAMTRYLVAHEYGHIVQHWIEHVRGIADAVTTEFDREYMKLRPGSNNDDGGGRWHQNVGEMIANDFRICVCGFEIEFWPHAGFPHPFELPEIQSFWDDARRRFAVTGIGRSE